MDIFDTIMKEVLAIWQSLKETQRAFSCTTEILHNYSVWVGFEHDNLFVEVRNKSKLLVWFCSVSKDGRGTSSSQWITPYYEEALSNFSENQLQKATLLAVIGAHQKLLQTEFKII